MSETIVITGGAGFIGSNFVRLVLSRTRARVIVFDKLTYAGNLCSLEDVISNPRFLFIRGDISDEAAVHDLFRVYRPAAVVNFAAETHVDRSIDGPRSFIDTNVVGTFILLEVSRLFLDKSPSAERKNFRFLHVSTDEVYGSLGAQGLFSETTPYAPNSPYSASKAGADHLVRAYFETYGLPVIITNCSNNYGPYQFPEKLIPLMILNALEAKELPIYGDGGNVRDWIYVEDHCRGVLQALQQGRAGEKYNIGAANELTNLDIVDKICDLLEELLPTKRNPAHKDKGITSYKDLKKFVQDRPGHDRRYAIDSLKIRRELGWKPQFQFDDALKKTIQWYIAHRSWCETVQKGKYERQRLGLKTMRVLSSLDKR